jgi:tellurite resistance protein
MNDVEISPKQAEIMARGMVAVARSAHALDARELALIKAFWQGPIETLPDVQPEEVRDAIAGSPLVDHFLRSCLLVAWADNDYTEPEHRVVERFASALGVSSADLSALERSVKDTLLGQLSHLANVDAVVGVAKKLG